MKSILSKEFRYVSSANTDVRKTFARIRKQLAEQRQSSQSKVAPLRRSK